MKMDSPLTLVLLMAGPTTALAQPFSSADICPVAGESYNQHFTFYQAPGTGGQSYTEDFGSIVTDSSATISYVAASATPNGSSFPSADVAQSDGNGNYTYYDVTATEFMDLGWDLGGAVTVASDPEKWMTFPLGYGTTWFDDHTISFTSGGFTVNRSGQVFGQVDGNDITLILPNGTHTGVKRLFMHDVYTDDVAGLYTLSYDFTYHFFFKAGTHQPLLMVQNLYITPSVGSVIHEYFCVYIDAATGLQESAGPIEAVNVFPQPAGNESTLDISLTSAAKVNVEVFDLAGALVQDHDLGTLPQGPHRMRLPFEGLGAGSYVMRVRANGNSLTRKLVIE